MEALKGGPKAEAANKEIEGLGLEFRIMTSFTSFVAVEEQVVNRNGTPTTVQVPVTVPEGVNKLMATGEDEEALKVDSAGGGGGGGKNIPVASRKMRSHAVTNMPASVSSLALTPRADRAVCRCRPPFDWLSKSGSVTDPRQSATVRLLRIAQRNRPFHS